MKKTISVNLANRNFYIEEDAYHALDQYIKGIKEYYKTDDPEGEIVEDFETRLGELFNEKMRLGHEVITIELTKEVIDQLGRIEDLDAPENGNESGHSSEASQSEPHRPNREHKQEETFTDKLNKKLYRDPKQKWLGGVIAGLAINLNVDVALLRLVAALLIFTPLSWVVIIMYIIGWAVLPNAETATDRLRMEGKPLNSENLWHTISEDNPSVKVNTEATESDLSNTRPESKKKTKNWIWWTIAFCLVLFIVGTLIWAIVAVNENELFGSNLSYFISPLAFLGAGTTSLTVGLSLFLAFFLLILGILILVGLFTLIYIWPISIISKSTSLSRSAKTIIIILWIVLTMFWVVWL